MLGHSTLAYHGTPHGYFEHFDASKRGEGADIHGFGDYGNGFYFTPDKQVAINYARGLYEEGIGKKPMVYTVKLKMNNPFNFDKIIEFDERFRLLAKKYGVMRIPDKDINDLYKELGTSESEINFIRDIEDLMGDNWGDWDIASKVKENGYDSIISHDGLEYVVFDASQIEIISREALEVPEGDILDEARVEHGDISDELGLLARLGKDRVDFTLYTSDAIYGHMGIYRLPSGNWAVGGVAAEYGYGPLMYELAMSYVYPNALMPTRDGDVRSGAINIWNKFLKRGDVRKEKLSLRDPDFSQEVYEDLGNGPDVRFIQSRYYYDGAKNMLDKLSSRSDLYIKSGMDPRKIDRDGNEYWMERYD